MRRLGRNHFVKADLYPAATTFRSPAAAHVIHQNIPHDLRGETIELVPAAHFDLLTAGHTKPGFMDESGRLQDGFRASASQCRPAKTPEFVVDHGHEFAERGLITGGPS